MSSLDSAKNQITALETKKLSYSYENLEAVNEFSFSLNYHEVQFLLGPNGAGKTTLIKMLCGLLKPDSGSVIIKNQNNKKLNLHKCTEIGYCPQHLSIWDDLTCYEQLVFMAEMYGVKAGRYNESIQYLLENLNLISKRNELAGTLSGGMQRCLGLALAMVHDPQILILDEPFVGLDIQSRFQLRKLIRSFSHRSGKAVLISTHNIEEAEKLADHVTIVDNGFKLKSDSLTELKSDVKELCVFEITLQEITEESVNDLINEISQISKDIVFLHDILLVGFKKKDGAIEKINKILNKNEIKPLEIKIRDRSLEDIFVKLTGRRL